MNTLRAVSLLAATVTMGLITGAFALYAHAIMPGLKTTDDRTFVAAFQAIDRAIINPWFMLTGFLGALAFTAAAAALNLGEDVLPWVLAALIASVVVFVILTVPLWLLGSVALGRMGLSLAAIRHGPRVPGSVPLR